MPIVYAPGLARLEDCCGAEEAETFLDWMRTDPRPCVDLSGTTSLHTALLQVLLAGRPELSSPPPDPFLAAILADLPVPTDRPASNPELTSIQPSNRATVS